MNSSGDFKKLSYKNKKKDTHVQEEYVSFKEVKQHYYEKYRRNYDNALRSKNLSRILSYDEE